MGMVHSQLFLSHKYTRTEKRRVTQRVKSSRPLTWCLGGDTWRLSWCRSWQTFRAQERGDITQLCTSTFNDTGVRSLVPRTARRPPFFRAIMPHTTLETARMTRWNICQEILRINACNVNDIKRLSYSPLSCSFRTFHHDQLGIVKRQD